MLCQPPEREKTKKKKKKTDGGFATENQGLSSDAAGRRGVRASRLPDRQRDDGMEARWWRERRYGSSRTVTTVSLYGDEDVSDGQCPTRVCDANHTS